MIIKFGIMCNGPFLKKWQYDAIKKLLELEDVELSLIIENSQSASPNITFGNIPFYIYKKLLVRPDCLKKTYIKNLFTDVKRLKCSTNRKGKFSEYFKEDDIATIKSYKLDFILRFGFGIIRGDILNVPKYGIWSFHHDDEQKYCGGPYCFWEIYNGEPVTGAILQRLTNKLDSGIVLRKGYFETQFHSYKKILILYYSNLQFGQVKVVKIFL